MLYGKYTLVLTPNNIVIIIMIKMFQFYGSVTQML